MNAKQKIVQGRGPSNINLASLFAALMFAGLHNQSPLLTMIKRSSDQSLINPLSINFFVMQNPRNFHVLDFNPRDKRGKEERA